MTIFANPSKPYYGPYVHREHGRKDFCNHPFRRHLWSDSSNFGFLCNFRFEVNGEMLNVFFDTSNHIVIEDWSTVGNDEWD